MEIRTNETIVIESAARTPIRVTRATNERTVLRQGTSWISMTDQELDAVLEAVEHLSKPRLGKLFVSSTDD